MPLLFTLFITCPVFIACPVTPSGAGVAESELVVSIVVSPSEAAITSGPAAAGSQPFEAIATFADGKVEPIDLVSWELSNDAAGTIDGTGLFTASTENGALTTVTATHNGVSGSANLTVTYAETIDEGGGEASAYDGSPTGEVTWLYPPDGVAVPRNVPNLSFMWEAVAGAEGYRISFTTPTTSVTALTTDNRWTAEEEKWVAIAATNAGGEVQVEVRALAGGVLYGSESRVLRVNRLDAQGSIYYWSTTDSGIVKVPIAVSNSDLYYAPSTGSGDCVACHVLRGDRMGVSYGGAGANFVTGITDISGSKPVELTAATEVGYYNTMNPDGTLMISTDNAGGFNLWDATTGSMLKKLNTYGDQLTQPDWSPDGSFLVAVRPAKFQGDSKFTEGKLVVIPIDDDGELGTATEIFDAREYFGVVDNEEIPSAFYPAISPDGEWVAFNVGFATSYDNPGAALWVIPVDGGDPIELAAANQAADLANSWPHWGPLPDDDVFWLTYSSKRDYGDEITDGRPQVWVTAFDPTLAAAGTDPSSPAFWLSNQDPETSNHSTFWGP